VLQMLLALGLQEPLAQMEKTAFLIPTAAKPPLFVTWVLQQNATIIPARALGMGNIVLRLHLLQRHRLQRRPLQALVKQHQIKPHAPPWRVASGIRSKIAILQARTASASH